MSTLRYVLADVWNRVLLVATAMYGVVLAVAVLSRAPMWMVLGLGICAGFVAGLTVATISQAIIFRETP